jgi:hypothetical protein
VLKLGVLAEGTEPPFTWIEDAALRTGRLHFSTICPRPRGPWMPRSCGRYTLVQRSV